MTTSQSSTRRDFATILEGFLLPSYASKGCIRALPNSVQFYEVGHTESSRGLLIIPDLFGWNTGRTRPYADFFANLGYYVAVPGLINSDSDAAPNLSQMGESLKHHSFESSLRAQLLSVLSHFQQCGIEEVDVLSFSWCSSSPYVGSWIAAHALADPELSSHIRTAVMCSPAIHLEHVIYGGNSTHLMQKIRTPVLLIPSKVCEALLYTFMAQGDGSRYLPHGVLYQSLNHANQLTAAVDMTQYEQGYMLRGDVNYSSMREAVVHTMHRILLFFEAASRK